MSARTLSRYNAFVRARNKNSACVSQPRSLFLSFSLSASLAVSLFLRRVSVFVASCVACHAPSFSHSLYSLRFPLFLFAFVSLYLRLPFRLHLSTRLLDARSPEIYSLSLSLAPFLRGRPLVRCPSLSFSVLLAASTRNFLLSRSSWITSRRFSFFSRLPVLSRPLLAFFFHICVHFASFLILIYFAPLGCSLSSSLSPLVSLDSLACALPRFSAAVSYRAWAPCRLVVIVAAFDRPRPNSHVPIYGKIRARPRLLNGSPQFLYICFPFSSRSRC